MKKLIEDICARLEQGQDLVLATIISHQGSTPRASGAKMAITRTGEGLGTIGGGLLEALVLEEAARIFETGGQKICSFDLTGDQAAGTDMICGGKLRVLVNLVEAGPANLDVFQGIRRAVAEGGKCRLVTSLPQAGQTRLGLVGDDGRIIGNLADAPEAASLAQAAGKVRQPAIETLGLEQFLIEPCFERGTVIIFGAGHVSQPTLEYAGKAGFRTVVMDDRPDFANRERFPLADEIVVLTNFQDCFKGQTVDRHTYLVIVTRGHLHDKTVLGLALKTEAGYIGMIGSRRKRQAVYEALMAEGVPKEELDQVYCPIGLDIGAETPEEIAISIVAELIQVRARGVDK